MNIEVHYDIDREATSINYNIIEVKEVIYARTLSHNNLFDSNIE